MQKKRAHNKLIPQEGELDLLVLVRLLWRKLWLILLVAVFCATSACVLTKLIVPPTYESSFTAFVNNKLDTSEQTGVTEGDTSAAKSLANTYSEILKSRPILEAAAKLNKIDKTYEELNSMVSTQIQNNTQLVVVKVRADSPEQALYLAKTISDIAPDYLSTIIEGSSMKVVAAPVKNNSIVKPNLVKTGIIAGLISALLTAFFVVIVEIADTRIKEQDELEENFGYSVVAVIPQFTSYSD